MKNTNNLLKDLSVLLEAGVSNIMISGAPGVGKSEIIYEICEQRNLKLLEVRLYEQGETAAGLPLLNDKITNFSKPWWFAELENNNYDVVLFDDFHLVLPGIQKFFYRLLSSRMLHNYKLKEDLKIILAGNFDLENAGASFIQSPIMGRIDVMLGYHPNIDIFLNWAYTQTKRFDTRVLAFLKANANLLFEEDPAPTVKYPSPRSWEQLSKIISKLNSPDYASAVVGNHTGAIFQDFWEFLDKNPEDILKSKPENVKQAVVYALVLAGAYSTKKKTSEKKRILDYVITLNKDVIFLFARRCFEVLGVKFITDIRKDYKDMYELLYTLKLEIDKL